MNRLPGPIRQRLESLLREGGTNRGIARELGIAPRTVSVARRELGIPPRPAGPPTISPRTRARITIALNAGHTDVSISRQLGVSADTVCKVRRELGIPPRPAGAPPAETRLPAATRAQITDLLRAGHTSSGIARQLKVPIRAVKNLRRALGIPPCRTGAPGHASLEDAFHAKATPTDDGHLIWPGYEPGAPSGPVLKRDGRNYSVYRLAFRLAHKREPVGHVTTGCGRFGCVHPEHVEDQPMRNQYSAIFGKAAA
jgi:DNA-binding NarL/FixJ family response regulator